MSYIFSHWNNTQFITIINSQYNGIIIQHYRRYFSHSWKRITVILHCALIELGCVATGYMFNNVSDGHTSILESSEYSLKWGHRYVWLKNLAFDWNSYSPIPDFHSFIRWQQLMMKTISMLKKSPQSPKLNGHIGGY